MKNCGMGSLLSSRNLKERMFLRGGAFSRQDKYPGILEGAQEQSEEHSRQTEVGGSMARVHKPLLHTPATARQLLLVK